MHQPNRTTFLTMNGASKARRQAIANNSTITQSCNRFHNCFWESCTPIARIKGSVLQKITTN